MELQTIDQPLDIVQVVKRRIPISSGNYPYVCARVKAKRARLLPKDTYQKLLMMDVAEITRFIGETEYKKEITDLGLIYKGVELLEHALNKNLASLYNEILGYCEGDLYTMLAAYLRRQDLWNLKTILRGKVYQAPNESILKTIVPAGAYSETYWKTIIQNASTIDDVIDQLKKNEFYPLLDGLRKEYVDNPTRSENRLEAAYYQILLKSIFPSSKPVALFLEYVRREIDVVNLKTLFMTKFENIEPQVIMSMVITGGMFSEKDVSALVNTADFQSFLQLLKNYSWYDFIKDKSQTIQQTNTLGHVIRALEKGIMIQETKKAYMYPLSILPIFDYLTRKRIEVENLRIIAYGKHNQLPDELIKELVVM